MIRLITSYYTDKDDNRQLELDAAIDANINNSYIDEVIILSETSDTNHLKHSKVTILSSNRPTFKDFFNIINERTKDDDINILINTDIYVDDTLFNLFKLNLDNKILCLLRWEYNNGTPMIAIPRSDCQDTWIWKGEMRTLSNSNFHLGKLGCDNRIAWEFENSGYVLENPCTTIKTIHLHTTQKRNYSETLVGEAAHSTNKDVVPPPYTYIKPI
tara:strand:- start:146 stop:790 length:645 start_codon:yes stop_codon:yes gene_type:complete